MNAWIYTRKSRHLGDSDDPHLLSHHLSTLKRLAASDGSTVAPGNVRTEIGSGESIAGRPVFQQLLREWEALPAGAGGIIYVMEPSRLSRGSNAERGRILDTLIRVQIIVASPERRYDPSNPSDELTWALVQSIDRNELQRYRQRVAIRRTEMARNGELTTGNPPWGYRWIKSPGHAGGRRLPGCIEPHPEQFPILVAVCRAVFTESIRSLARRYSIDYSVLHAALHNPVICGYPCLRWRRRREEWTWPDAAGDYPAACSRAEWEAIQLVLNERYSLRLKTGPAVENGWCRAVVTFVGWPGPVHLSSLPLGGGLTPVYRKRRPGLRPLYVAREPVHDAAVAALERLCCRPMLERMAALAREQREAPPGEVAALSRRLERERDRFAVLKDQLAAPGLDEEEQIALLSAERGCRRRLDGLKAELKRAQIRDWPVSDLAPLLPSLAELQDDFPAAWQELTGAERQEIVRAFVKEIPVTVIEGRPGVRWERTVGEPVLPDWMTGI